MSSTTTQTTSDRSASLRVSECQLPPPVPEEVDTNSEQPEILDPVKDETFLPDASLQVPECGLPPVKDETLSDVSSLVDLTQKENLAEGERCLPDESLLDEPSNQSENPVEEKEEYVSDDDWCDSCYCSREDCVLNRKSIVTNQSENPVEEKESYVPDNDWCDTCDCMHGTLV